jgi:hypothetical protein
VRLVKLKAASVFGRAEVVELFQRQPREFAVEAICRLMREWRACSGVHRD